MKWQGEGSSPLYCKICQGGISTAHVDYFLSFSKSHDNDVAPPAEARCNSYQHFIDGQKSMVLAKYLEGIGVVCFINGDQTVMDEWLGF